MGGGGFATRKCAEAAMRRGKCVGFRREEFLLDIAQGAVHTYEQESRYADPDHHPFSGKSKLGRNRSCASCNHPTGRNRAAFRTGSLSMARADGSCLPVRPAATTRASIIRI